MPMSVLLKKPPDSRVAFLESEVFKNAMRIGFFEWLLGDFFYQ